MRSNIAFHISDRRSHWPDLTFGFVDKRSGFEIRAEFSSDSTKNNNKVNKSFILLFSSAVSQCDSKSSPSISFLHVGPSLALPCQNVVVIMPLRFKFLLATSLSLNNKGLLWLLIRTQSWQCNSYFGGLLLSILCTWPSHLRMRVSSCRQDREFPHSFQDTLLIIVSNLELLFTWDRYTVKIQHYTGGKKEQLGRPLTIDTYRFFRSLQLRIQGRGPWDLGSPLFLDQKSSFWDPIPPSPYLKGWIRHWPFL